MDTSFISVWVKDGAKVRLQMPTIVSIEDGLSASLTETSTMIYGYKNNFCMDLGNTEKITFKYERINPFPYNDNFSDPEKWSNGKWMTYLEELLDYWQNLGQDYTTGEWTGGFRFTYVPEDPTLFPPIDENVFMVGSLNKTYSSVQRVTFTLPMVVSSMTGATSEAPTVTLHLRTSDANNPGQYSPTVDVKVLEGYDVPMPPCPEGWADKYQPGRVFMGWKDSDGNVYAANDTHMWLADETLTAQWEGAMDVTWRNAAGDWTITVPTGANYVVVYLVGGGGGAGGGRINTSGSGTILDYDQYVLCGGGGGAGEVYITERRPIKSTDVIQLTIGEGGTGGTNRGAGTSTVASNGGAGGDTILKINGVDIGIARGGEGGRGVTLRTATGYASTAGGTQYRRGGSTLENGDGDDGVDGASELIEKKTDHGKGGKGHTFKEGNVTYHYQGGAGGASAAFRYRFLTDAGWKPASGYYESLGGSGFDYNDRTAPWGGLDGGGGGSGMKLGESYGNTRTTTGGSGCALFVWFK